MLLTFFLAVIGWIVFRSATITDSAQYIKGICDASLFCVPWIKTINSFALLVFSVLLMLGIEWLQRDNEHGLSLNGKLKQPLVRWCVYLLITLMVFVLQSNKAVQFIYFQF